MRKWIKRISIALGVLLLVLFAAIYFGGRIAVQKYLARSIVVGKGRARLVAPRFRWSLDLAADSALYDSPTLKVVAGATRVSVNLFRSVLHFSPSVLLETDTLSLKLAPVPDTAAAKPKRDSLPFPDFKLPAAVSVRAGRIDVADSAGALARCDGIVLESRGPKSVFLSIREAGARQTGALRLSLQASADWNDKERLLADLAVARGGDSVSLHAGLSKANLLKGSAGLRVRLISSAPYVKVLKLTPTLPKIDAFTADIRAAVDSSLQVTLAVETRVSGLPDTGSLRLGPQRVDVKADFGDTAGHWSLGSRGARGEDVSLAGNLFVTGERTDSLADPAYLVRHLGATAKGHVRGVSVAAAGKRMAADLELAESRFSREGVRADLTTGDGSRVQADLRHRASAAPAKTKTAGPIAAKAHPRVAGANRIAKGSGTSKGKRKGAGNGKGKSEASGGVPPGLEEWDGEFSADLVQGERWITAFTDTNLVFRMLRVQGQARAGTFTATTEAYGLKAYGALADSLRLYHRYDRSGYELAPSLWYLKGTAWHLNGKIALAEPGRPMSFHLGNPEFGSADFSMPRARYLEAHVKNLFVERLPYRGLESLAVNRPRVTADFAWDQAAGTGNAEVTAAGRYKHEGLEAHAQADWNRETLEVRELKASLAGSEVKAGARLRLRGKPFYALAKLAPEDYESVTLRSGHFDLAKALSVAMPQPPLKSGTIAGDFGYSSTGGFSGAYVFGNLQPQGDAPASIKEMAVYGRGDTLVIKAVTVSGKEPLLNDTVSLSLTGVLGKIQTLAVGVKAAGGMTLGFNGDMHAYKDIEGRLGVDGDLPLPGKSGELRGLKVRARLSMPFRQGLKGLSLDADTLRGAYAVAGIDTQSFSATVKTRAGRISIPDLVMKSKGGDLSGRVDYAVSTRRLLASLSGQSLVAQLGADDKIQIRDFRVDAQSDSTQFNLQAAIGSASGEHMKSPMRATGDFSRIALLYRQPLGKTNAPQAGGGPMPFLRLSAVMDSSAVRYRMRSLETLQGLFKKSPQRRQAARRTKPMQVEINLETAGNGNTVETDVFRVSYVGNFSLVGTYPYALARGRVTSREGSLGAKKQAYTIRQLEVKWLNSPIEEGQLDLDAEKKLARTCDPGVTDSCSVTMRLSGALNDMQFSYDSDCQGSYGTGVEVSALIFSVRRGCYSAGIAGGGPGMTYEQQALTLLETPINSYLSEYAEKLSGKWIASAQFTGLGALAQGKSKDTLTTTIASPAQPGAAPTDAVALEILSKEFWRMHLRARSAYKPDITENVSPWAYLVGVEWRPPLFRFIDNPVWKRRVKNNVNLDASVFTDPDQAQITGKDQVLRRLGLNYNYDFWGYWWNKPVAKDDPLRRPSAGKPADPGDSAR